MIDKRRASNIVVLAGYQRDLHKADVAVLTPSLTSHAYRLVDGSLQRLVRSLTPVVVPLFPSSLVDAHRALELEIQHYAVWMLLQEEYPPWAIATLLQVQAAGPPARIFMVRGNPRFSLTEFTY